MTRRPLDPRKVNVLFDTNAFDGIGRCDPNVDRLLELGRSQKITLVTPWSVRAELHHPHTPLRVREAAIPQVFSYIVDQNSTEQELYRQVRDILQGNAARGKHDADARHVAEAAKYGGYFITHDKRINETKRQALEAVLPQRLWIVTSSEFLAIYDRYEAAKEG